MAAIYDKIIRLERLIEQRDALSPTVSGFEPITVHPKSKSQPTNASSKVL